MQSIAKQTPAVQTRLANPVVEKGWQGVKPADAAKLKKTIAQQNPPPKELPKPTPLPTPVAASKPTPQAQAPAPKPQPQVKAPAPKPPQQKPAVQKNAPAEEIVARDIRVPSN
jgi:hypothetical protein